MRSVRQVLRRVAIPLLAQAGCGAALAQQALPPSSALVVKPVAEKTVESLPGNPLYWRVERFTSATEAVDDAAPDALLVNDAGQTWRFTLGTKPHERSKGILVATIGPVPKPIASSYLLRVNRASGPMGAVTPVHTHPGSEAFYVLAGRLCQRTVHGTKQLEAGQAMNGDMPGMVMQVQSCGTVALDQFVMFVVDATKPFSSPASFKAN